MEESGIQTVEGVPLNLWLAQLIKDIDQKRVVGTTTVIIKLLGEHTVAINITDGVVEKKSKWVFWK